MNRAILCVLPLLLAAAPAPPIESLSLHQEIAVAQDARTRESWSEAAAALARAQSHYARPDPLLAYDQAVCAYHAGDFLQAATAFEQATHTSDPALSSAASYNLGNAQAQMAASKESAKESAAEYRKAIDAYRHAIQSQDQTIRDRAMANGELAMQRLQEEEQKQEQEQEQEQDQQQKQEQDQQQQNQDKQEQSEEQQDQQQQEQQEQQQQQQQEQSEEQQDQQQDQSKEQQPQQEDQSQQEQPEEQQKQQEQPEEQQDQQQEQPEQQEQPTPEEPAEEEQASTSGSDAKQTPGEMSQEEAERMLQAVRDRQRARRQAREEAEAAGTPPSGKDW